MASEMVYQFKSGSRIAGVDAQTAGEALADIAHRRGLTPANVLDESREASAPLHNVFEWNDPVAAEKYRLVQAGSLIRAVVTVREESSEPVRAFVSVKVADNEEPATDRYVSIEDGLRDPEQRQIILARALRELEQLRKKYEALTELASLFSEIDRLKAA